MLKKIIIVLISVFLIILGFALRDMWLPYYNEYVHGHKYILPNKNQPFVVAVEPGNEKAPVFLQHIIEQAFPEFKVEFDNASSHPNLIIRSQTIIRSQRESSPYKDIDIPYITISGEPEGMPARKYRKQGLPFADIVVYTPTKDNEIYVPFMLWSGVDLKSNKLYDNYQDRKFLVYVSGNCVAEREEFFKLARAVNAEADALGVCSNTVGGKRISGGYADLNDTYSKYNFVMAMENVQKPGYITEKIVNAFNSGAIPIYWGDTATVQTFFNPKAFVDLNEFHNFEAAVEYIQDLQNNPAKLEQMRKEFVLNSDVNELWKVNETNSEYIAHQALKFRELYDAVLFR